MPLVLLALFPAALMALVGVMSARSPRGTFVILFLCAVWLGAGTLILRAHDPLAGILCLAQAAVGMVAWISALLRLSRAAVPPSGPSDSN
jgi:hypothetical protein